MNEQQFKQRTKQLALRIIRLVGPAGAFAQKPTVLNEGVYYTRNRKPETRILPLSNCVTPQWCKNMLRFLGSLKLLWGKRFKLTVPFCPNAPAGPCCLKLFYDEPGVGIYKGIYSTRLAKSSGSQALAIISKSRMQSPTETNWRA